MSYVQTPVSVWDAFTGREPGTPVGPDDPELRDAVVDRIDPVLARPVLRAGVESVELVSVRGAAYVMARSPDDAGRACYLRLTPQEWQLALLMDGTNTVARLVAEFARIAGRLAPDEVRRVVAELAGNRMLDELPGGVFTPVPSPQPRALPVRAIQTLIAVARGRRIAVFDIDGLITGLYRAGGRLLFTRAVAVLLGLVAVAGLGTFAVNWWRGGQSVFLASDSYLLGAFVLLVLHLVVLATHELGHALGAKHAGREVPAAGLLVYFGLPSVFVDTSDVWMAGRRARMITTAAGPAAGLVLAGASQLVALSVPALEPLAFKLAFVGYLHALLQACPLLALDGYYLLTDWLEIAHLRGRALAYLIGRLRRRAPGFKALDREGRLVAGYAVLALLWLVIAVELVSRVVVDRVTGLVTGLWFGDQQDRLLLAAILLGLGAPVLYLLAGRIVAGLRRWRTRVADGRREADAPRRQAALAVSELGGLPDAALASLAARARWLHPATGRQLTVAGSAASAVYVVVDGALQGRRPGDPAGTVRHHVGPGGVVGLADALTGRPTALNWYTAGTTLLALPTVAVATVIGPLPGPPPADRAEAEALFADTPALADLADDERLALIAASHPVDIDTGAPVELAGPTHAVIVESGVIALPDGVELRRGTLVGPVGDGIPGMVAQARTPVRMWIVPNAAAVPPLVGASQDGPAVGFPLPTPRRAPAAGAHPAGGYPPLAVPPGPPDDADAGIDTRFERTMWWLVGSAVAVVIAFTGAVAVPGEAWAEMPTDRVLLTAERGELHAVVGTQTLRLTSGARRYVIEHSRIEVGTGSTARLTFRGGGSVLLCAGSVSTVGRVFTDASGSPVPHGSLAVDSGRVIADTTVTSGAFAPLALLVRRLTDDVHNVGAATYAVDPGAVAVGSGRVVVGGVAAPTGADLGCGDDVPAPPPSPLPSVTPSESPSAVPTESAPAATESPSPTPSPTPSESPSPTPTRTTKAPNPQDPPIRPRPKPATIQPTRSPTESASSPAPDPPPPSEDPPSSSVPVEPSDAGIRSSDVDQVRQGGGE